MPQWVMSYLCRRGGKGIRRCEPSRTLPNSPPGSTTSGLSFGKPEWAARHTTPTLSNRRHERWATATEFWHLWAWKSDLIVLQ